MYKIGLQFTRHYRKHKYIETITDILTTTNEAGDVAKIRYVATHEFCGKTVIDSDIVPVTIARSLSNE